MSNPIIKIENKEVTLSDRFGNKDKTKYFELALSCLRNAGIQGVTTGVMRERFAVIDKLEGSKKKFVELLKNEAKTLLSCVKDMTWGITSREILNFEDYITELTK